MSFARPVPSKSSSTSTVIPPLPALPKLPSRLQSKRISLLPPTSKKEVKLPENRNDIQLSSIRNQNDLEDIVNNLSTIVKRSEELLTPIKQPQIATTVRRTSSLHLTKIELDRRKFSNSIMKPFNSHCNISEKKDDHQSKLHDSISDRSSECSTSVSSSIPRRTSIRSLHNVEKYSGIKCALPSFTSTIPNTFKGLEKHDTPMKNKQTNIASSMTNNQITPANTNSKDKSPWRLRFEKFINHEEPTPISPSTESVIVNKTKTSSLGKENRTPSFRLPARRTSKFNLPS
ncbi:unnamed protein product [Rotaria sp. Silwood1]|nr:unnamed protein product [Rotaria sp. Silwood1]CAF3450827.1 unnamed protein product [Rotaria sp. Silwood1]CAF3451741.1 unnamed protein product [Rotaria sp. Silwood1]CAF3526779.1 unnamed protein product [Rotaria sp. Silwood1]CAF4572655.1 unnamed protein product [Rotaria sp. Silwood1]